MKFFSRSKKNQRFVAVKWGQFPALGLGFVRDTQAFDSDVFEAKLILPQRLYDKTKYVTTYRDAKKLAKEANKYTH